MEITKRKEIVKKKLQSDDAVAFIRLTRLFKLCHLAARAKAFRAGTVSSVHHSSAVQGRLTYSRGCLTPFLTNTRFVLELQHNKLKMVLRDLESAMSTFDSGISFLSFMIWGM